MAEGTVEGNYIYQSKIPTVINIDSSIEPNTPVPELAKKEAEELKNMDFQTAWTHTLKNAEFATSFVELLQEMGMEKECVCAKVQEKFQLSFQEAEQEVEKYWK